MKLSKGTVSLGNLSCVQLSSQSALHNLHHKLSSVTYRHSNLSRNLLLLLLLLLRALQKVELDSTFHNDCVNDFIDFFSVAQCDTPRTTCLAMLCSDQPIRILIILSSVLLGRSFASCWQSLLRFETLREKLHEKLPSVTAP